MSGIDKSTPIDVASEPRIFRDGYLVLAALSSVGLIGYALTYLVAMPAFSSVSFVPTSVEPNVQWPSMSATVQAAFILLYAFTLLPVVVLFSIRRFRASPGAIAGAASILCLSLVLEVENNLPILVAGTYPQKLTSIPADILLYLHQAETLRFLSFDVPGFTLAYIAFGVYAALFWRTQRLLSRAILLSIVLFAANVPFLAVAPQLAVALMSASVVALAVGPIELARMALREPGDQG